MLTPGKRRAAGFMNLALATALLGALVLGVGPAAAQTPAPWQMGMQAAHSPVEHGIQSLNTLVLWIIVVITIFVAGLLAYVVWRYDHKRNPVAGRVSHNSVLEVAWTALPVLILVVIAIPSFRLVYFEDRTADADLTVKVTGHQWYWEYTYPDAKGLHFDSYMVADEDLKGEQKALRHLAVDNQLVVPAGKNIRILTTSADVIHSFFIPSLGVQRYAIPGRTIETWFRVDQPGDYYGECNQICGTNHSVMPISIHAVTPEAFKTWLAAAPAKFSNASLEPDTHQVQARFASAQSASATER
jgi:cytochrome c oxidase subunit 2